LGGRDGKVRTDLLTYPRRRTWNASDGTSSPDARHGLVAQVSPTLADLGSRSTILYPTSRPWQPASRPWVPDDERAGRVRPRHGLPAKAAA